MYYDEWLRIGEKLGLSGSDLLLFLQEKEEECLAREERARRREEERRQMEINFELQMKEKDLEIERIKSCKVTTSEGSKSLRPRIPKFDEANDNIDSFLERFERFAIRQDWERDTWAMSLSSLLSGQGLEVFTSLPIEEANKYDTLKRAILKRYQLTEEGFRVKFRQSRPLPGESVFQFIERLRRYFTRWTDMAGVEQTFHGISELLIKEQFIEGCSTDLAVFLKERVPTSIEELTRLAEQYIEAHKGASSVFGRGTPVPKQGQMGKRSIPETSSRVTENRNSPVKTCFICNKAGHLARDCRQNNRSQAPKVCFICNKTGHIAKDCRQTKSEGVRSDRKVAAVCAKADLNPLEKNTEDGKLKLASGETVPILAGACTIDLLEEERNLELKEGFVGADAVRVLRDTGCELASVKKKFVKEEQLTGKEIVMITIDGDAKVVPLAKIWVDTPYYVGELEAMVLKSLICDLVIGNVAGVLDKPDPEWKETEEPSAVAAVMTRAQHQRADRPTRALTVPKPSCEAEVDIEKLKESQKGDSSLKKVWDLAEKAEELQTKGGAKFKYVVENGVLFRAYFQKNGDDSKQIVVPTDFRKRVMELAHESIVGGHLSSKKTEDRILTSFHWPGITGDVGRFCRSCDVCQKTIPKGRVKKVPLGDMPVIEEPFHRVAIDLIGPIIPVSEKGQQIYLDGGGFCHTLP
ncbi:uncharacterized protein LOC132756686 [Ruditapes philippinarum]|uniref:uncharacterized protein LOC132756686 n=1 Tax=Ruditapes philippinarum TaxID=129788 RepID=UPI00295B7EBA|nr:uncharacterized protein LOC132756686 [Ruditapes philippinarum]